MAVFARSPQTTILIPAFNEERGLPQTLAAIRRETRLAGAEVIVIDDGSRDRTAAIAAEAGATVIRNWTNFGYGASLKRGVRAAAGDVVAWFDADGQHSAADLADMIECLHRERAHAVFGARAAGSHVVKRRVFGKRILKAAAEATAGRNIPDFNCGLRVFRRAILERYLDLLPDGFSASTTTTLLLLKRNYHVIFHPVHASERIGKSTVRQLRDGLRAMHTILRLRMMFSALRTFSFFAAILIAGGVLYGVPLSLIRGEGFPVLAALTIILGVQVFCLGVVCDQISALRLERLGPSHLDLDSAEEEQIPWSSKRAA
jgi:glycosyltransferase involved in cell wall biosynthesis